ncbi:MAG: hypothetical protein ACYTKD_19230 [Planctomycetota bacterium]|jgi:hypothetical protein
MALNEESRLLSMRILQNFVREKKGKWSHDDWAKLMKRVRKAGFEKIDEGRMGKLLEDNRERWLSGDNSVGPPPPGTKPAAKKPEPPRPAAKKPAPAAKPPAKVEKAVKKEVGKEKPAMPEQPKKEAPKPAPVSSSPSSRAQAPAISAKEAKVSDTEAQEKHQRRIALIKSSQDLTKESMETEMEIRKQEHTQVELQRKLGGLKDQRAPLETQRTSVQGDVDTSTKDIASLQKGIEELTVQRANLEGSVGNRKKERSEHVANIVRFKSEKEGLIT